MWHAHSSRSSVHLQLRDCAASRRAGNGTARGGWRDGGRARWRDPLAPLQLAHPAGLDLHLQLRERAAEL